MRAFYTNYGNNLSLLVYVSRELGGKLLSFSFPLKSCLFLVLFTYPYMVKSSLSLPSSYVHRRSSSAIVACILHKYLLPPTHTTFSYINT